MPNEAVLAEDFLDPIPEDDSVAAKAPQRVEMHLSAASAVGSSDSGDIKSDTGVLLGGDDEEQSPMDPQQQQQQQQALDENSTLFKSCCGRRVLLFSIMVVVLVVGIGVGIYFIATAVTSGEDNDRPDDFVPSLQDGPTIAPTLFAPFDDFFINDDQTPGDVAPSPAPTYSSFQIETIDEILLELVSNMPSEVIKSVDIYDNDTTHGSCRFWLTQTDHVDLEISTIDETAERVQQRYILCLLYQDMSGEEWELADDSFLDSFMHECLWAGITCDNDRNVAVIDLAETNLSGSLPDELARMQKLELLKLSGNEITGTIPSGLLDLPMLVWLDLSSNQLTGSIVTATNDCPVEILYLQGNQLEGSVPFFSKLEKLWIHENQFSSFDESYTTSLVIRSLIAYDNQFEGNFPQSWFVPSLKTLDMGLNELEGRIPTSLWQNAPNLELLLLNENQLEGSLPTVTGSNSLETIWLQSNKLSGTIPQSFGTNWVNLTSLLLHDNSLQGSITENQCLQWKKFHTIEADCKLPSLSCACCTKCYGG